MSFRTVFIAVEMNQDDAELDRAVEICRRLEAHMLVMVVGVAPPPPASPYGVVSNDIWVGEVSSGQDQARQGAERIEAKLADAGISASVEPHYVDRGTIATLAARFARYADITLIPQYSDDLRILQGCVSDGALFESGRPVLVLPKAAVNFPDCKRIMVAWDASVEASKAVRDSIGLMKAAERVDAVLIDPVPSFEGHGQEPGADLAAYLGRHGISANVQCLPRQGMGVSDVLRRAAVDLGADLIVMGGFGHSRLRRRIFSGTTTKMLQVEDIPVLMAH